MSLGSRKKYFAETHSSNVEAPAPIISEEGFVIVEDAGKGKDRASTSQPCEMKTLLHEHEHVQERKQIPIPATTSLYGSTSTGLYPSTHPHPVISASARRMQQEKESHRMDRESTYEINYGTTLSSTRGEQEQKISTNPSHHNPTDFNRFTARGRGGEESTGFSIGAPLSHSKAAAGFKLSASQTTAGETPRPDASSDLPAAGTTAKLPRTSTLTSVDLNNDRDVSADGCGTSTELAGDREKGK